ncbi:protein slx4 [Aspergillus foveolatus]|uniref:protein slx4 n=1 Tax=Aspergillus foveolatus TaxID=210207 RepID=UPI003CCE52F0
MQIATDFVVLSSSPETSANHFPTLPLGDSKKTSLRDPSMSLSPSPAASPTAPKRSRFFSTPPYSQSKTVHKTRQDASKEKTTTTKIDENSASSENGWIRRGQKIQPISQVELQNIGQDDSENKENAPTKPKRARKKQEGSGTGAENLKNKTISGKVTKTGVSKSRTSAIKPVKSEQGTCERNTGEEDTDGCKKGDLQLELAMTRRRDWTPTKKPANPVIDLDDEDDATTRHDDLGTLLSGYEYTGMATASDRHKVLTDSGPTKRRRIELVDSRVLPEKPKSLSEDDSIQNSEGDAPICAVSKPSKKPKPKTKRLTTLTARVTAPYDLSASSSDSTVQGILITAEGSAGAKPKSRRTKRKADENREYKVSRTIFSPEEAVKSLDQQDLVFGTCSQLQREDSPDMLRDTQIAVQESEKEFTRGLGQLSHTARYSSVLSRFATQRNLWSVAARDTEGQLADVEVVDLVDSPEAPKFIALSRNNEKGREDHSFATYSSSSSNVLQAKPLAPADAPMDEALPALTSHTVEQLECEEPKNQPKTRPKPPMPYYKGKTDLQLALEVQRYGLKPPKNREKLIELLEKCWVAKHGLDLQEAREELQSKTTAEMTFSASEPKKVEQEPNHKQTKTDIQSKITKTRSQFQPNVPELTRESRESRTATAVVKEDKQHNPKLRLKERQPNPKRSFIDVEEIQDSEDEFLPSPSVILNQFLVSPPRKGKQSNKDTKQNRQELPTSTIPSSPSPRSSLALDSSMSPTRRTKKSRTIPPVSAKRDLLDLGEQITKAVRAQPRRKQDSSHVTTGTRKHPTWHEKILMYDPIYLEDFTSWLNTEGLALVDEAREVATGFVRQWCESKGICCCFRIKKTSERY